MAGAWLFDTPESYDTDATGYPEQVRDLLGGQHCLRARQALPAESVHGAEGGHSQCGLRAGAPHQGPPRCQHGRVQQGSLAEFDRQVSRDAYCRLHPFRLGQLPDAYPSGHP